MNILKRKLMLAFLKKKPALSRFEVCDKLRPYLRQYKLSLNDTGIIFPEESPGLQNLLRVAQSSGIYEKSIPYDTIIYISETAKGLDMMLRTGHVFRFRSGSPVWMIDNVYKYGEPTALTLWWWKFSGNTTLLWWKIKKKRGSRTPQRAKE